MAHVTKESLSCQQFPDVKKRRKIGPFAAEVS